MLCQDHNSRGHEVAYCLGRQGLPNVLIFIEASLVQSVPDIKFQVKVVTVGASVTGFDSIEEMLPCARMQICRLQVLEALYCKIYELAVPKADQIRNLLLNILNTHLPRVYSQYLSDMEDVTPVTFLQYFLKCLHPHRCMWIKCWAIENNQECSFFDHFSSHRQKLLTLLSSPTALPAYVQGLLDLQALHMETSTLNVAPMIQLYHTICLPDIADLVVEELDLLPHVHYKLKETSEGYFLEGSTCSFLVSQDLATCSCSIFMAHQLPCQHVFAVRLWVGESLFELGLLLSSPDPLQDIVGQQED